MFKTLANIINNKNVMNWCVNNEKKKTLFTACSLL